MPTIDTSTIEGFEGMSAEQKVEALLKAEIPEKVDLSLYHGPDGGACGGRSVRRRRRREAGP